MQITCLMEVRTYTRPSLPMNNMVSVQIFVAMLQYSDHLFLHKMPHYAVGWKHNHINTTSFVLYSILSYKIYYTYATQSFRFIHLICIVKSGLKFGLIFGLYIYLTIILIVYFGKIFMCLLVVPRICISIHVSFCKTSFTIHLY